MIQFVTQPFQNTVATVQVSPVGNWWLEWCEFGLVAAAPTQARPFQQELPDWLKAAWTSVWAGQPFDLVLCSARPLTTSFVKACQKLCSLVPESGQSIRISELAHELMFRGSLKRLYGLLASNPWPLFVPSHRVSTEGLKLKAEVLFERLRYYETSLKAQTEKFGACLDGLKQTVTKLLQ